MSAYSLRKAARRRELRRKVGQPRSELKRVSMRVLCRVFPFLLDSTFPNSCIKSARFSALDDRISRVLGPHTPPVSQHGADPVEYLRLVLDSRGIVLERSLLEDVVYRQNKQIRVDIHFLNEVVFGSCKE